MAETETEIKTREDGLCCQAALEGNAVSVAAYLKRGANISAISKRGILVMVAERGRTEALKVLLDAGANINDVMPTTYVTPLMQAARNGHLETVQLLLERGANIGNTPEEQYRTLSWSIKNNNVEIFELLVAQKANVNVSSQNGETLLMTAAWHNSINIIHTLLAHGADVNARSGENNTPLRTARRWGNAEAEQILKEAGAEEYHLSPIDRLRDCIAGSLLRWVHRNKI